MPIRTCIGCRTPRPQHALLRLRRRSDGHVVPARSVRTGRSAYLCASRKCYDRAVSRRAFARALGGSRGLSVACEGSNLWTTIEQDVNQRVEQLQSARTPDVRREHDSPSSQLDRLLVMQQELNESDKAGV